MMGELVRNLAVVGAIVGTAVGLTWSIARWVDRSFRKHFSLCEHCGKPRVLLDEETDDVHLDAGQRREEQLGSADYQVWWCGACEDGVVVRQSLRSSSLVTCDRCRHATATEIAQTVKPATSSQGGEFRVDLSCAHCGHSQRFWRYTPRLPLR